MAKKPTARRPATGSTAPEKLPRRKLFHFGFPSATRGIETMAPSGKFWMAIPMDRVRAGSMAEWTSVPALTAVRAAASTTPVVIPSGTLWMVTADSIIVVREALEGRPSAASFLEWRCGVKVSMRRRKAKPTARPTAAGTKAQAPMSALCSIEGCKSDQMLAATITPAAKPRRIFLSQSGISFLRKKTIEEPRVVPRRGTRRMMAA